MSIQPIPETAVPRIRRVLTPLNACVGAPTCVNKDETLVVILKPTHMNYSNHNNRDNTSRENQHGNMSTNRSNTAVMDREQTTNSEKNQNPSGNNGNDSNRSGENRPNEQTKDDEKK